MESYLKTSIWQQFGAAIDFLADTIEACPDEMWRASLWLTPNTKREFSEFWYVTYHTLFWLDLYLTAGEHFELFAAPTGMSGSEARREGNRLARELGWDSASGPLAGELSGGTAQKLAVITALLAQPEILLLDEPYQGMDADSQQRFWALLWAWQEGGRSAVVSSHSTDALAKASKVVEIEGLTLR